MDPKFTAQNPIVDAAQRIRARRRIAAAVDAVSTQSGDRTYENAHESLRAFAEALAAGCKRLDAILGKRGTVKLVRFERPLRLRVRLNDRRVTLDLDEANQLVCIAGLGLDGDYQFDPEAAVPSLINLSKISSEAGYGEALTPSLLLQEIARDVEPQHP